MLLKLTTTHQPATDLSYLLHKHPDRLQAVELPYGKAHIFYPQVSEEECTMALLLDIDPIEMVRNKRNSAGDFALGHYVNDRPYVASSLMSVALSKAFATAMNGRCKDKPELVNVPLPLKLEISALPAPRGGELLIRKLFEPLGYTLEVTRQPLDERFEEWGESKYYTVTMTNSLPLKDVLTHLYVLIPVLDNDKHYWVSQNEVDKLIEKGKGWLSEHPEKDQITKRYLKNIGGLARQAMSRLMETDGDVSEEHEPELIDIKKESLHQQRLKMVANELKESGAKRILDLGCGEGKLLKLLLKERQFEFMMGVDVSYRSLEIANERLNLSDMAPKQRERIELIQGALTYQDKRLNEFDAAAIVEVIEHLDENRLAAFERVVFECAKPKSVILTTPNGEYNENFEQLSAGEFRHSDHRFEWSREEFENWGNTVADKFNYKVKYKPVGEVDEKVGAPSQMAIFSYGN